MVIGIDKNTFLLDVTVINAALYVKEILVNRRY